MRTVMVLLVSQTVGETGVMLIGPCCTFRGAIARDADATTASTSVPAAAAAVLKKIELCCRSGPSVVSAVEDSWAPISQSRPFICVHQIRRKP